MKRSITVLFTLILMAVSAHAQDEYRMEIGPAAGASFYMGDVNQRLYRNTGLMGGIVARYNCNPRLSFKADLTAARISGSTADMKDRVFLEDLSFNRTIYDMGVQIEGGFLGYGLTRYNGCHRVAPYYLTGIGLTFAPKPQKNDFAFNIPLGIGVRYKMADRWNVGLEWTMRFSSSDRLDVTMQNGGITLEDPYRIKGKFFKNKDSYSYTMLTLTYDIFKKPCDCN